MYYNEPAKVLSSIFRITRSFEINLEHTGFMEYDQFIFFLITGQNLCLEEKKGGIYIIYVNLPVVRTTDNSMKKSLLPWTSNV